MRTARLFTHTLIFCLGFTACAFVVNRMPPYQGAPSPGVPTTSLASYQPSRPLPSRAERYSVADAITRVEPAVVNIDTVGRSSLRGGWERFWLRRWFGRPVPRRDDSPVHGVASGVIVSRDGYVLTNNHVVDDADRILVTLPDQRSFDAQVVGTDVEDDLAILKIDGHNLPTAPLGNSARLRKGEWVIAIGNPLGFESTVTVGVVSAERRGPFSVEGKVLRHVIQTDASINQGNSGGALVNLDGELVGINTAIVSTSSAGGSIGIGFAIPVNDIRPVIAQLIRYGRVLRPWIGIKYEPAPDGSLASDSERPAFPEIGFSRRSARGKGVLIREVLPGSPAAEAGLRQGDIIRRLGPTPVAGTEDVYTFIARHTPGQHVSVVVRRAGQSRTLTLRLGNKPRDAERQLRE
jgi:S1-C subfamily serine protease